PINTLVNNEFSKRLYVYSVIRFSINPNYWSVKNIFWYAGIFETCGAAESVFCCSVVIQKT
ncbi:hypothetical protein, partial [Sutterella sp.]|uniref:hypothetical protein n=1 Tax=Sutterella sp. TaxID=1981025 RepID=UPI0028470E44